MSERKGMTRRGFLTAGAFMFAGGVEGMVDACTVALPDDKPYRLLHVDALGTRYLTYTQSMHGLPQASEGKLILHVTDIHGDREGVTRINPTNMRHVAQTINMVADTHFGVSADRRVLALTGDYVNQPHGQYSETAQGDFEELLGAVDVIQARDRLSVRGNHDRHVSWWSEMPGMLQAHGYRLSEGEHIDGVEYIGQPDFVSEKLYAPHSVYESRRYIEEISERLDRPEPKVVLTHSSCAIDEEVTGIRFANMLAICGHAHGCQVPKGGILMQGLRRAAQFKMHQLGFEGRMWDTRLNLPQRGRYADAGASAVHVTNGVGDHPHRRSTRLSTHTVCIIELVGATPS